MQRPYFIWVLLLSLAAGRADDSWPAALSRMPLSTGPIELSRTNCAQVILGSFQSNATVKALIFMPGATDELYFFRRVQASVTNAQPSLLDALIALTNQSPLRLTFREPFLLIDTGEDVLDLDITIQHQRTADKLRSGKPLPHLLFIDRDWTQLLGVIKKRIGATLFPYQGTIGSWHFYRHTYAAWNLTPWETLEASALAGKTKFIVTRGRVVFELDERVGTLPKLDRFPGH